MTLVLAAQSVVFALALVAIVVFFLRLLERRETAWASERAALVNHIQFGERLAVPVPVVTQRSTGTGDDEEPDEIGLVGTKQAPQREQK